MDKIDTFRMLCLCRTEHCFANDLFLDTIINVFNGNGRSYKFAKTRKVLYRSMIYVPLLISVVLRLLFPFSGHFVDAWNCLGQTPLFVAAYTRKLAMVNMLLNLGADPNVICVGGYTATHGACYSGSRRILNLILKFNGDLTIHDVHRSVPA